MSLDSGTPLLQDAQGMRFGIIAARFNGEFVDALLENCVSMIEAAGGSTQVARVPGSGELPFAASTFCDVEAWNAIIVLGIVIRGETDHHNHLAHATGPVLQQLSVDTGIPIINGIIVTNTVEEAAARSGADINRGAEFAHAAIEMAHFTQKCKKQK
ncbi:MAG: 6,7-dimethyl-8-ribityllumazine synthase [Opitutales bacterium]